MVGINAKNKNILDLKYICPKCSLILQDPVQLSTCGHRLCQSCINIQHEITIICPQCKIEVPRQQMMVDRGFKNEMQTLPIDCSFCQWTGSFINYQDHLNQSHFNLKCEHCGEQFNSVDKFNEHKVLQCEKISVDCSLKDFGCNQQIMRNKIEDHYLTEEHQNSILKVVRQIRSQLLNTQMESDLSRTTTNGSITAPLQKLYKTLNIFSGGIETLVNDGQCLSNEVLQILRNEVQLSVEETHRFSEEGKHNHGILNQEVTPMKEKINDMKYVSYDGTFVWKITNVRQKMIDAESERRTSIYSPPFYSSPSGYKMRVRLYLNGDGNARRTHMSLFFVLMRGLNDPILKFPFTYKVTFCLYDQSSAKRHIIDSFRPDIKSNSFQRPRSDMNIASGIPKFAPLGVIQQGSNPYVQDNTMFIKVMVDFADMPKNLLTYALSLNPGLPTHIQQAMIKQEAERRAQQQPQVVVFENDVKLSCEETDH